MEEDSEAEEDGAAEEGKHCSLAHLGTFAAMFAGGLPPCLSSLHIWTLDWRMDARDNPTEHVPAHMLAQHRRLVGVGQTGTSGQQTMGSLANSQRADFS
ncbi:hypothetical protein WOLCODRAFT_157955 [Wolfiporia cocos MD-104 SS10]|uniref:Uncharacterized protein n=1 Tax=Wolfiporia cocos (strain MD-104) TaxID=742152 RepID=A0A2H3J4U0_WOLCO|nr:hypothetical protein WOLCODRAFT_157955 [Wolfiporia cocos MD-104 SS10]